MRFTHTQVWQSAEDQLCSQLTAVRCAALQVTPVHLAAEKGHFALVSILLEHGADPSALDQHR